MQQSGQERDQAQQRVEARHEGHVLEAIRAPQHGHADPEGHRAEVDPERRRRPDPVGERHHHGRPDRQVSKSWLEEVPIPAAPEGGEHRGQHQHRPDIAREECLPGSLRPSAA